MVDVKIKESHVKTLTAYLKTSDIQKLILDAIGKDFLVSNPSCECKFSWGDETVGSPPYKVGVQCHVTIIKDMNYIPVAPPKAKSWIGQD